MLGENGWLTRRLNYVKLRRKNLDELNISNSIAETNEMTPEEDLERLKTSIIHKTSRDELVRKLNSTRELRKQMLKIETTDLREHFPFFLAEPTLVSIFCFIHLIYSTNMTFVFSSPFLVVMGF